MIECKADKRLLKNRNEGFRQVVRQRPQACAESSAENESLRDNVHRTKESVKPEELFETRLIQSSGVSSECVTRNLFTTRSSISRRWIFARPITRRPMATA